MRIEQFSLIVLETGWKEIKRTIATSLEECRKDGSLVWLEAFATRIEYNGQSAVQAMFLDIDEHKKSRRNLKKK